MKKKIRSHIVLWSALGLLTFSLGASAQARSEDENANIQQSMTPEEFKASGLNKLSPEELANLNSWLQGYRLKAEKKAALRESKTKLDLIVSRIDGEWGGIGPGEIITLEDGTKWKLANKDEHYGGHADHPAVAIYKSLFGWKMRVSRIAEFYVYPVH